MSVISDTFAKAEQARGWRASLDLALERSEERTILRYNRHEGPLRVQRPFYPEADGTCHLYLLHPPGGLVQGDELELEVRVGPGAHVLITTPGATKCYRSEGLRSSLRSRIVVADDGCCEWLPQETIVFDGAQVSTTTVVELGETSCFVGWEILCAGRPAAAESFIHGTCDQSVRILRGDKPLLCERLRLLGGGEVCTQVWGCDGSPVVATLFVALPDSRVVEPVRAAHVEDVWGSELDGVAVFRCAARHTEIAKARLAEVWDVIRGKLGKQGPHRPRIWST